MNGIDILNPNKEIELVLCKPSKQPIGVLANAKITLIKRVIDDVDSLEFEFLEMYKDRFNKINKIDLLYEELHEERIIQLNENEFFVIKSIDEEKGYINKKIVKANSLEQKLNRINMFLEDTVIVLLKEDVEKNEVSIGDLIYSETGWKFGYIDEFVRFDIVNGQKVKKVRWQESVNESWYTFLTETIADTFSCIVFFNTKDKIIDLYSVETLGENLGLYLSYDNYMKSIQKQTSSDDIVTRLLLTGKDEITIRDVNPSGKDYIEDYSYFIENEDMSEELINALTKHQIIIEKNQLDWTILSNKKLEKMKILTKKESDFYILCENIKVLISIRDAYERTDDKVNAGLTQKEIDNKNIEKQKMELEISSLETEIKELTIKLNYINIQMDRVYSKDENGELIFTEKLLSELNEFLYYESYSNTSYLNSKDLMEGGRRELARRCVPTVEYSVDSINFLDKVRNNKKMNFSGYMNLGDIVILHEVKKDKETLLYFVGYEYNPSDNSLNITLSNKKTKINNTKNIADYLKQAKKSKEYVDNKSYIFNQIKYNKF